MKRLFAYITDSRAELLRVTWPTRRQAIRLSLIVIVFSIVLSLIIGGLDYIFSQIIQKLILKG